MNLKCKLYWVPCGYLGLRRVTLTPTNRWKIIKYTKDINTYTELYLEFFDIFSRKEKSFYAIDYSFLEKGSITLPPEIEDTIWISEKEIVCNIWEEYPINSC